MAAVATRRSSSNMGLYPLEAKRSVIDEDMEDDDYVIEDDLTDEEIALVMKHMKEREAGLVQYIPLDEAMAEADRMSAEIRAGQRTPSTDETDDYVIEDDLTQEEIAYMKMCLEEYKSGLVKYIPLEDIN